MFPTLSDLLQYLFGFYLPLPIQTFGFFLGLSFAGAYITTSRELKRKEAAGLLHAVTKKITLHERVSTFSFALNAAGGALIGYKVLHMVLNYAEFAADAPGFILSSDGNLLGALAGAVAGYYLKKQEDNKAALHKPEQKNIKVHPHEHMTNIVFIAGIAGILGAKIFHNLENLDEFAADPVGALLSFSGLTFYGGLIVAAFSVLYYTRKQGIDTLHMIDAAAPGLILAYAIGRMGCQLSGDGDWGIVNLNPKPDWMAALPDWMWAFDYPHNVISEGVKMAGCEGRHCFVLPQPVYPTPFYETLMGLVIFGILWGIRTRISAPGVLFSIYLLLNGIERFSIEQIRVNSTYSLFGHAITQAEIISFSFILLGIAGTAYFHHKAKRLSTDSR
jgi:phosphatidylglycerol:prolipoprotein diacylglycerol transferase